MSVNRITVKRLLSFLFLTLFGKESTCLKICCMIFLTILKQPLSRKSSKSLKTIIVLKGLNRLLIFIRAVRYPNSVWFAYHSDRVGARKSSYSIFFK